MGSFLGIGGVMRTFKKYASYRCGNVGERRREEGEESGFVFKIHLSVT